MESHYYVKQGFVQKYKDKPLGGFDLNRFFKWAADVYNITYVDKCCNSTKTKFPVRFNSLTGSFEYANAAGTWVDSRTLAGSAINATATATAAQVATGLITSTSAAATTITLPTATLLATQLGASRGSRFIFIVDNSLGANTVTIAVGTGITAASVVTGGTTLTAATGTVGTFQLIFTSATTAILSRLQ